MLKAWNKFVLEATKENTIVIIRRITNHNCLPAHKIKGFKKELRREIRKVKKQGNRSNAWDKLKILKKEFKKRVWLEKRKITDEFWAKMVDNCKHFGK